MQSSIYSAWREDVESRLKKRRRQRRRWEFVATADYENNNDDDEDDNGDECHDYGVENNADEKRTK